MVGNHVHLDPVLQREGLIRRAAPATRFHMASVSPMRQCVANLSGCQAVRVIGFERSPQVRHLLKGRANAL